MIDFIVKKMHTHQIRIFLGLTIFIASFLLFSHVDFHGLLSQGDHGRDFLASEQATQGLRTYHDYWWVYGPLMPQYYGWMYEFFGNNMLSVLIGKALLKLLATCFIFWGALAIMSPVASFLTAIWFVLSQQLFFFTHNHIGGLVCICAILALMLHYLQSRDTRLLGWSLFICWILSLIKVNFAFSSLAFIVIAPFIIHHFGAPPKKNPHWFFIISFLVMPLIFIGQYWLFTSGLTLYEIRQCLPYLASDHPYNVSPFDAIKIYFQTITQHISKSPGEIIVTTLFLISSALGIYYASTKKFDTKNQKVWFITLGLLGLFFILNIHEFIASGVWYRSFWSQPFSIMAIMMIIFAASTRYPKVIKIILTVILIGTFSYTAFSGHQKTKSLKIAQRYLNHPKGKIYIANHPKWTQTVLQTTQYLEKNLRNNETFFALPYDTIYYYLTSRPSPTRQTIFFEHIKIPEEQERKVIAELEKNNVNWIVLSSRFRSVEQGLGNFGSDYCPIIAKYMEQHFTPVAQFGDWKNHPGWAWNHGTLILKRK